MKWEYRRGHTPVVHLCVGLFTPPGLEYTATSGGLQTWISALRDQFRGNNSLECQFSETVLFLATTLVSVCVFVCTCWTERVQAKNGRRLSRREAEVLVPVRLHPPAHTPSLFLSLPLHVMFLHICHSGNRKRKGGKEQWRERKRGT